MATTILTTAAALELGIDEDQLRELLKPLYGNAATIKRISTNTFRALASQLAAEQEQNQDIDVSVIEKEALLVAETETPALLAGDKEEFVNEEQGEPSNDDHHFDDNGGNAGVFSPDTSDEIVQEIAQTEQTTQTVNTTEALTVGVPEDARGRVQRLGTAEKDLREGTLQLKTEISKAQGRGAGVATGLAFMQGLLEGEQEVLDMFTKESLEVFDQLQLTIDTQVAEISSGTGDLLGKISSQRALNQERLQAIRSRVASMIHKV
jgi:hypothetical protein